MRSVVATLALMPLLCVQGCGGRVSTIDGTTAQTLASSSAEIEATLAGPEAAAFREALRVTAIGHPEDAAADPAYRRKLHGKTGQEVIVEGIAAYRALTEFAKPVEAEVESSALVADLLSAGLSQGLQDTYPELARRTAEVPAAE